MDDSRFDELTRSLTGPSRRSFLAALGAGIAALFGDDADETAAKRTKRKRTKRKQATRRPSASRDRLSAEGRKKKKKKKKRPAAAAPPAGPGTTSPPPSGCTPVCGSTNPCGPDGCGGSCGSCTGGSNCNAGTCTCPGGQELCGGACIPVCGPGEARNPLTCGCCLAHGQQCNWENNLCCSGDCEYNASTARFECSALDEGEGGCTFDTQCASGNCNYDPVIDWGYCGA
jgi:hypothetical protein